MVSELQRRVAEKVALWLQAFCLLRPHSLWRWAGSFVWLSFRLGFRVSQNPTTLQVFLSFVEGTCDWKNSCLIVILFGPRIAVSSRETRWKPILLAWFSSCGPWHHGLFSDLPPFERLGMLPLLRLSKGSCPLQWQQWSDEWLALPSCWLPLVRKCHVAFDDIYFFLEPTVERVQVSYSFGTGA